MRPASTIITSNHVFTGLDDAARPLAVCIQDGIIVDIVSRESIDLAADNVTDYEDAFICAGFHDGHLHAFHSALYSSPLATDYLGTSEADCVRHMQEFAKTRPTGWLLSQGWREYRWNPSGMPSKTSLDAAFPDRPVAMYSGDAHTLWVNSCALRELGITADSIPPAGGIYAKDENGELTGIIQEAAAMELMPRIVGEFSNDEIDDAYRSFTQRLAAQGITSICDMSLMALPGLDFIREDVYSRLDEAGELPVRVTMFPTLLDDTSRFDALHERFRGPKLTAPGYKQFFDGVSSMHTAYVLEPYINPHFEGDRGRTTIAYEDMRDLVLRANAAGHPVRIHTIGDQAIHLALDIFEESLAANGPMPDGLRNTLEHLENFQPDDMARLAKLDVIASVQPPHITLDPLGPERDLGEDRCRYMWPFKTFLDDGTVMAFGTDSPVVAPRSMDVLFCAVTRQDPKSLWPEGGWQPQERIGMADALRAYTAGSAAAAERSDIGLLKTGLRADLAILDTDLLSPQVTAEPIRILQTKVLATYLDGKTTFIR
ncbi:amidohydrolase [Slackia heliotrinireducens]|uniref:amidohydrolase n=1 Tax=Slackia heliotrinireducens TaxID=84110 RepID=UPI0033150647